MRGLTSTVVLLLVLGGLVGYIYFVDSERPASGVEARDKVFAVEADKITELRVTSGGETSVLRKTGNDWSMVEPVETGVDMTAVSSLTSNLATLEVNRVVDENASDLAQYGLATPAIQVGFTAEGTSGTVALGDKTATQGDLYAARPGEQRVFLVPAYLETTFNKKPFDLRDKSALKFERDKVDRMTVATGGSLVELVKNGTEWQLQQPVKARGDYGAIDGLLSKLSTLNMTKIVAPSADDLKQYGLTLPAATATVSSGSNQAVLALGADTEGGVYARDLSRPMIFTVDTTLLADLKKGADEYRDKDLFEFRPFNAERIRITRGADTYEFQKVKGSGENATESWQRVEGSNTSPADTAKVDDLLTKLSNLRAASFGAGAPGSDTALTVSVSYDGGKFERVRMGKGADGASATRDGEPGTARLDATPVDDVAKALDAALAPPAPPATPSSEAPGK